jgi:hypothetical protein
MLGLRFGAALPRCAAANVETLETVVNAAASNATNIINLLRMVSLSSFWSGTLFALHAGDQESNEADLNP